MRLTIAQALRAAAVVALVVGITEHAGAQTSGDRDDAFAPAAWHLELGGHVAIETWNYNISHETMYGSWQGLTYGLRRGLTLKAAWPLYSVEQRGVDGIVLGATVGMRGRLAGFGRTSVVWEFDLGVSKSDNPTPPRGTRFNYLVLSAVGVSRSVAPRTHVLATVRWIHVSNNGLAGRERNPDIEAVGPHLALLVGF